MFFYSRRRRGRMQARKKETTPPLPPDSVRNNISWRHTSTSTALRNSRAKSRSIRTESHSLRGADDFLSPTTTSRFSLSKPTDREKAAEPFWIDTLLCSCYINQRTRSENGRANVSSSSSPSSHLASPPFLPAQSQANRIRTAAKG